MPRLLTASFVNAWLASFFGGLAFFLFVHFPGFLDDLGASELQIGLIVGATAASAIAVRPRIGVEMDRRGRRPVVLLGAVLNVGVLALYPTISAIGVWVYVVRVIHGVAEALLFASLFTYAADLVPAERRTQGLALFGVSGMLPIALGGVIGDVILDRSDFDTLFWTAVAFAVIALGFSIPLRESRVPEPGDRPSFFRPLRQPDLLRVWWITAVFSTALTAYFTFLRTFVDETGIGTVGAFFAAYAAAAIALRVTAGWLPDRVGQKRVLYPAFAIFASGFVVLAGAGSDVSIVVAGALCGTGHAYIFPILYSLAFSRADAHERGSASAIYTGLFDVGALVGAPVLGQLIASFGYTVMFTIAAIWVVAGSVGFAIWDGDLTRRRAASAPLS